jgi:hypothetical protein
LGERLLQTEFVSFRIGHHDAPTRWLIDYPQLSRTNLCELGPAGSTPMPSARHLQHRHPR